MSAIFELENVSFSYDTAVGKDLFDAVDLKLMRGEALVILGPSGEGKSTLLKMMAGLVEPQKGTVKFEGESLYDVSAKKRKEIMRRIGMTFQNSGLFDSLSCGENLRFPLEEAKSDPAKRKATVAKALDEVGLSGIENLRTHEISGGMRKRVGIARALILSPEVIFYDDPTAGLDPITSDAISDLILDVRKKYQMTVVFVTADLHQAFRVADRIAFLYKGKFIQVGTAEEIKRSQNPVVNQFVNGLLKGPLTDTHPPEDRA